MNHAGGDKRESTMTGEDRAEFPDKLSTGGEHLCGKPQLLCRSVDIPGRRKKHCGEFIGYPCHGGERHPLGPIQITAMKGVKQKGLCHQVLVTSRAKERAIARRPPSALSGIPSGVRRNTPPLGTPARG